MSCDFVWLFHMVPWICLRFVIVIFPDHTHLLFIIQATRGAFFAVHHICCNLQQVCTCYIDNRLFGCLCIKASSSYKPSTQQHIYAPVICNYAPIFWDQRDFGFASCYITQTLRGQPAVESTSDLPRSLFCISFCLIRK